MILLTVSQTPLTAYLLFDRVDRPTDSSQYSLVFLVADDGVSAADRDEEEKLATTLRDDEAIRRVCRKAVGRSIVDAIDML